MGRYKKLFKYLPYIAVLLAFYVLIVTTIFQDISLEPIVNKPYTSLSDKTKKAPVYLISYADGPEIFYQNQNFLVHSALNKGIDHFINYRRNILDDDFLKDRASILNEKCGAGYWLWKPWIILKTLKMAPPGAIIIYADSGYCFCGELEYIFQTMEHHHVIIPEAGPNDGPLSDISKPKMLEKFGIDPIDAKKFTQIIANFIVIKNTPEACEFISKWFDLCCQKDLITGKKYGDGHHLHDQTLMNIAYLKHPRHVKLMKHEELCKFVTWHHRKTDRDTITLTAYLRKHFTVFERKILNAPGLREIRYYLRRIFPTLLESQPQANMGL